MLVPVVSCVDPFDLSSDQEGATKVAFFSGPLYRYFSVYAVVEFQKQFAYSEVM
jgi:hypothetical protein